MSDETPPSWMAYLAMARERHDIFANPPGASYTLLLDRDEAVSAERQLTEPAPWNRIGVQYRDDYIALLRDAVRFPDGHVGAYSRVVLAPERTEGIAILPYHQGRFLLLRQFRHATRRFHIEVPRGFGEPGCSAEDNARRELREELQLEARTLSHLGTLYSDTGVSNIKLNLFFAHTAGEPKGELNEGIVEVLHLTPAELKAAIASGEIADPFTMAIFARLMARGEFPE